MVDPLKTATGIAALLESLRSLFSGWGRKKPPPKVKPVEVKKLDRDNLLGRNRDA